PSADAEAFQDAEAPDADNVKHRKAVTNLVRKAGHIGEFALLAFLIALHVSLCRKRPWLWAIASCAVYAAGDELHQLFSAGRSGSITDVLIDICGAAAGAALFLLLTRRPLTTNH
ncbi:MAG: VanZ family protein, partial [Clostridia bacterium]|nr:VanZ family protein [Clostridia bacterium]